MVSKYGSEDYKFNHISAAEYGDGDGGDAMGAMGKAKRGGVGGRGSKSNNHKEAKVANKRRFEKHQREEAK